jgi:predicted aldo/keto reductase-like oxidoreductase
MLYRKMPKNNDTLSILGFGCMRLPATKKGQIDEPRAVRMSGIIGKSAGYASQCTQCGECLQRCPQHIDIPDCLQRVAEALEDSDLDKRVALGKKMLNVE